MGVVGVERDDHVLVAGVVEAPFDPGAQPGAQAPVHAVAEHGQGQRAAALRHRASGLLDGAVAAPVVHQHRAVFVLAAAHRVRERQQRRADGALFVVGREDDEDHAGRVPRSGIRAEPA